MDNRIPIRGVAASVVAASVLAIAGGVAGPPSSANGAGATAAATKKVKVGDDFYAPKRLRVVKGTRIEWVWSRRGSDRHDVYLDDRPDGVRHFHSPPATAPFSFARKLRKPGRYKILCTFHEGMRMRIDVAPSKRARRR